MFISRGDTMDCHECVRAEVERPTGALYRYCSIGLCRDHLVAIHTSPGKPLYTCLHQPERRFDTLTAGSKASRSPALTLAA